MAIGLEENEFLLRCSCHSIEHHAMLIHETYGQRGNNIKEEDDDWYLSVSLDLIAKPYKRLKLGLLYIFCPRKIRFGMYSEIVLKNEDVDKLAQWIQRRRQCGEASHDRT